MPRAEVDVVRVVRTDLDFPIDEDGPATPGPEMIATKVECDGPDPSPQFQFPYAAGVIL